MRIYAWFLIFYGSLMGILHINRGGDEAIFWIFFVIIPSVTFSTLYLRNKASIGFAYALIAVWVFTVLNSIVISITGNGSWPLESVLGEMTGSLVWGAFPMLFVYFSKRQKHAMNEDIPNISNKMGFDEPPWQQGQKIGKEIHGGDDPIAAFLEKGTTRRSIQISLPMEAWTTFDQMVAAATKRAPSTSSVVNGHVMIAGLIRFRQRLRVVGSSILTMQELLRDLDGFESASESFSLNSKSSVISWMTRDLKISLPDDTWIIFDNMAPVWNEVFPQVNAQIFLGYFLLFGLWWFQECVSESDSPQTATQRLLLQIMASGEIK